MCSRLWHKTFVFYYPLSLWRKKSSKTPSALSQLEFYHSFGRCGIALLRKSKMNAVRAAVIFDFFSACKVLCRFYFGIYRQEKLSQTIVPHMNKKSVALSGCRSPRLNRHIACRGCINRLSILCQPCSYLLQTLQSNLGKASVGLRSYVQKKVCSFACRTNK